LFDLVSFTVLSTLALIDCCCDLVLFFCFAPSACLTIYSSLIAARTLTFLLAPSACQVCGYYFACTTWGPLQKSCAFPNTPTRDNATLLICHTLLALSTYICEMIKAHRCCNSIALVCVCVCARWMCCATETHKLNQGPSAFMIDVLDF
jgi:hypothetical protein